MSEYLIQEKSLSDIADAIREKAGSTDEMTPAQMVEAILGIQAGGSNIKFVGGTVAPTTLLYNPHVPIDLSEAFSEPPSLLIMFPDVTSSISKGNGRYQTMWVGIQQIVDFIPKETEGDFAIAYGEYFFGYSNNIAGELVPAVTTWTSNYDGNILNLKSWRFHSSPSMKMLAGESYRYFAFSGVEV